MTFRELVKETKVAFHLNPEYFAEPVVYIAWGAIDPTVAEVLVNEDGELIITQDGEEINFGTPTEDEWILVTQDGTTIITQDEQNTIGTGTLVIRTINVHVLEEKSLDYPNEDTEETVHQAKIKTLKDRTLGILRPCIGDQIIRMPKYDEDQTPYTYQGEHSLESEDSWRLTFERFRRDAQGFA